MKDMKKQVRRSNKSRRDNTHRMLWYILKRTSVKHSQWRDTIIYLFFELYEIRRENPGVFLWVRAVDGVSIYLDQGSVADLQIAQEHILVNAAVKSPLIKDGDRIFGKEKRHEGSGNRQWRLDTKEEIDGLLEFLKKLPKEKRAEASVSRNIPQSVREFVLERDNGRCRVCHATVGLHFDHVIPFSKGGSNEEKNIRLLCAKHNLEQGASMRY